MKKGTTNNPNGRPKGKPNKVTKDVKQAYQMLIENNLGNLDTWLKGIAEKDPAKAFAIILDLSEYVIPKLARNNIEGDINKTITVKVEEEKPKQVIKIGDQIIEL